MYTQMYFYPFDDFEENLPTVAEESQSADLIPSEYDLQYITQINMKGSRSIPQGPRITFNIRRNNMT